MDALKQYVIVEFPKEKKGVTSAMAIVSRTWLIEEKLNFWCYWPQYFTKQETFSKALLHHKPLIKDKCLKCEVIVKRSSDDYVRLCEKLKLLEDESNVESDDNIKRRIVPKHFSGYSSSGSEGVPEIRLNRNKKIETKKPPAAVEFISVTEKCNSNLIELVNTLEGDNIPGSQIEWFPLSANVAEDDNQGVTISNIDPPGKPNFTVTYISDSATGSVRNTPTPSSLVGIHSSGVVASINVETQLTNIEVMIKSLMRIALDNQERIKHISAIVAQGRNISELPYPTAEFHTLKTMQEAEHFEKKLEDSKYFAEMVAYFNLMGGKDYKDTVRRVLRKLFTNDLCKQYNWCGRGEKENFNKYKNILQLILGVTRKQYITTTFKEINDVIKIWLRNAGDRDGGRNQRRKKIISDTVIM